MPTESETGSVALRTALRELVALSMIPAAWVGREPPIIAAGLADVLVGSLHLDFAFVRLCDPKGGAAFEFTRGHAWKAFPEWLRTHQGGFGQFSRREIVADLGCPEPCHGVVIAIGVDAEAGLVAAACTRTDFPSEIDQLLLSVAANHAAAAFQNACLRHELDDKVAELGQARNELEMKVAERTADLRRSEAFLAEAQNISHIGSFGWNVLTEEIYWSEETFRIFEFDRATTPSVELLMRQRIHPEDVDAFRQVIERALWDGQDFAHEYRIRMPDGRVKYIHVVAHSVRNETDNVHFVGAVKDVTEEKWAQAERARLEQRLHQAAKMEAVGRLAGGIAHDFNNILGAILGHGELAQDSLGEGSPVRRHVDQVMHAGARGKALVERILAFSRSGMGERLPMHVQSVVQETLDLLAASLPADVHLDRRLAAPKATVLGDATQFHQVTMNLCRNAVQAMTQGGVLTVELDCAPVRERRILSHGVLGASHHVRLSVADTGSGIPPAVLERMFDPFFTTKGVGEGTGLGLALVHGIVTDLGGAIDVATQVGTGTTFTIWLPATGALPALPAEAAADVPRGHGERVMVVDDERALVALAEETLAQLGYEPVGFESSVTALEEFRAEPGRFDLVLTDEMMPNLTGTELAREIRQLRPDVSIILMSGHSSTQLGERARAAGVVHICRKPLVRRDIAEPVARALHGGKLAKELHVEIP